MGELLTAMEAVWLTLKLQMPKSRCACESVLESMQVLQTCTLNLFEHFE